MTASWAIKDKHTIIIYKNYLLFGTKCSWGYNQDPDPLSAPELVFCVRADPHETVQCVSARTWIPLAMYAPSIFLHIWASELLTSFLF